MTTAFRENPTAPGQDRASARDAFASYIAATNTHRFEQVRPLVAPEASYWFGERVLQQPHDIQAAFEQAWATVADEVYEVDDCRWLVETADHAVVTYRYRWRGFVGGVERHGGGLGTNVLRHQDGGWRVVHEHLTPAAAAR